MKLFKKCKVVAALGVTMLALTGCGQSSDELAADVGTAMQAGLPSDFTKIEFEEPAEGGLRGPAPALVFQGKSSALLVTTKPQRAQSMFGSSVTMHGLARTKNGRYFRFTYRSALLTPDSLPFIQYSCTAAVCRHIEDTRSVTTMEAKRWFFNSEEFTPERFKELFGEDAPPQRVEA